MNNNFYCLLFALLLFSYGNCNTKDYVNDIAEVSSSIDTISYDDTNNDIVLNIVKQANNAKNKPIDPVKNMYHNEITDDPSVVDRWIETSKRYCTSRFNAYRRAYTIVNMVMVGGEGYVDNPIVEPVDGQEYIFRVSFSSFGKKEVLFFLVALENEEWKVDNLLDTISYNRWKLTINYSQSLKDAYMEHYDYPNVEEMISTISSKEIADSKSIPQFVPEPDLTLLSYEQVFKWGFIDKTGKWVILPQFDYVEDFSEGLAAVEVGKKMGYIDSSGKIVIPAQFKKTDDMNFHEGLAAVEIETNIGKWGISSGHIDKKGNNVIPFKKDALVGEYHEGLARISENCIDFSTEIYGYIDHHGKYVIPSQFWRAGDFSEGLATAHSEAFGEIGYIDKTGSWIIAPQFVEAWDFREGLAAVSLDYDLWGFVDKTGRMVIPPKFQAPSNFSEGLAFVSMGESHDTEKFGYIDKTGKIAIPLIFDSAKDFSNGLAAVSIDEKWGYIDKSGRRIIQVRFEDVKNFSEDMAAVLINGRWGYIDKAGREIIPCKYPDANSFHEGLAAVKVDVVQYHPYLIAYETATETVQKIWDECNKQLLEYPYNIDRRQLEPISMTYFFMNPRLSTITDSIVVDLKQKTSELMVNCYQQLKSDKPKVFAGIYLRLHPEAKSVLENLKLECRCNNHSEEQLVIWIADISLPQCTCRDDYWNQYGTLFSSRTEFDSTYNISEQGFLDDVKLRQSLRTDIQEISSILTGLKSAKFKDGFTGKKEDIVQILQRVQYHRGKYYYDEVVEMMFTTDAAMTKEWEKNGQLFSSKNEFYEAYVSGDYKNVLKEKKSK